MADTGVVITGTGLVTPLGLDVAATWEALCAGQSGIGALPALEQRPRTTPEGGQVADDGDPPPSREAKYLRRAITAALTNAGLDATVYAPHRRGIMLGTTLHGMRSAGRYFRCGDLGEFRTILAPAVLQLATSGLRFHGPAATTCSACSSGLGSLALAVTMLNAGELDVVIAGGYDPISEYSYAGFNSLRLISPGPIRPFCRDRAGMKVSEGYGIVVLERSDDARHRGAAAKAVILAIGEAADAHHLTQPRPDGEGVGRAIRAAMAAAEVHADDIGMICAHATGTPDNDGAEHAGLHAVLGDELARIPCVAMKSQLGHTLGGAGAVELILAIEALRTGRVPATLNVAADELEFADMRLVARDTAAPPPRVSMNLSLGFGGANTCVLVGPADPDAPYVVTKATSSRRVAITGIGVVLPGAIGVDAFAAMLNDRARPPIARDTGPIPDDLILPLIDSRRVRRMSDYVKLTLAAVSLACDDAAIADRPAFAAECIAMLGTCHGSAGYSSTFYEQIVREGLAAANPLLFAEGVPNAAAAHLSLMLGVKGGCQTILGSRTSGLDALRLAALRIGQGACDRAIVSAGEEFCDLVNAAYRHCGLNVAYGCGAMAVVLEEADAAQARGVRPRATLDACAAVSFNHDDLRGGIERALAAMPRLQSGDQVFSCASAPDMDRFEERVIQEYSDLITPSRLYGRIAEAYSVMPLASLAAGLLQQPHATGVCVCCTDPNGLFAAARLTPENRY